MPPADLEEVTDEALRSWPLPAIDGDADKGSRGVVLVVGGSAATPGAVLLAGEAALRVGAGKLRLATADSTVAALGVALPESMVTGLPEAADGEPDDGAATDVAELAASCEAVLVGPGFGDPLRASRWAERLAPACSGIVVDALATACVNGGRAPFCGPAVLTPNASELEHATGEPASPESAAALALRTRAVVAVGAGVTWVAEPSGRVRCIPAGGPGLGVSGSGDVRAGAVAGLLARGSDPAQAAVWGAFLHARAGERLASRVGRVGFLARDLLPELTAVLRDLGGDG